jgi:hypothetical protein
MADIIDFKRAKEELKRAKEQKKIEENYLRIKELLQSDDAII